MTHEPIDPDEILARADKRFAQHMPHLQTMEVELWEALREAIRQRDDAMDILGAEHAVNKAISKLGW